MLTAKIWKLTLTPSGADSIYLPRQNRRQLILTARGFSVKGPFQDYDIMTYTDKEGTDLILTAEVEFSSDTTQIRPSSIGRLNGSIIVTCHVNLVAYESLTRNRLWTKSVAITPITVELISRNMYPNGASLATLVFLRLYYRYDPRDTEDSRVLSISSKL